MIFLQGAKSINICIDTVDTGPVVTWYHIGTKFCGIAHHYVLFIRAACEIGTCTDPEVLRYRSFNWGCPTSLEQRPRTSFLSEKLLLVKDQHLTHLDFRFTEVEPV